MSPLENHGVIIRELRSRQNLSVRKAAQKIERSIGWLSEIENGTGTARLTEAEFERIVTVLGGQKDRPMFKTWIANHKNQDRTDKTFDGAILKFIRIKKGLTLAAAAKAVGFSYCYLSKLERGIKPITLALRIKIMRAYGYNPSSFKNLSSDPVRSRVVPNKYKFEIFLRTLSIGQIESIYEKALSTKP